MNATNPEHPLTAASDSLQHLVSCEYGGCTAPAKYQTYFLGGPFLKLCDIHEEAVFPSVIFTNKDSLAAQIQPKRDR